MRDLSLLLLWGCCGLCNSRIFSTKSVTTDVNECEDTTVCPPYATCTDTVDSYYCTCKQGFVSSNGLTQFTDPGVTCKDVDECSQNPQTCGPNSICKNLLGRYKCSCLPGFSSPTGNDWTSVKLGRFSCKDVDECANPGTCPEHATCHNHPGSYSCVCNQGFESSSGKTSFQGPGETCEDVDECARNSTLCGPNSICTNSPGEYNCSCLPGFFSPVVWTPEKPEDFRCTDINECSQNPQTCGPNSICKNLLGRYKCSCWPGFSSPTGNNWTSVNLGHFSCKDMDECANPRTCPEHATCHNHPGSYSCVCNQGFESSSGKTSFQGPGETCEALCPKCPENADCFNNTQCACKDGFQSTSGKKYTEPHEKCEDIDECKTGLAKCSEIAYCRNEIGSYYCSCIPNSSFNIFAGVFKFNYKECYNVDECARNSTLCGLNSICTNSPGEYNCSCLPGFFSPVVWTPEKPEDFRCTDIDECLHMRLSNARCTNTLGSYFWTCFPGFAPSTRQLNFTGQDVECRDVDECSQDPSPCGPNSVCTNAPGSYSCSCIEGFRPNPEGSLNFSCKRVPFKCKEDVIPNNAGVQQCQVGAAGKSEYGSFCALVNATFSVLDNVCENKTTAVSLKSTVESLTSVLEQTSTWSNFTKEETSVLATVLLESVKSSTLAAFLKPSANVTQTVQTKHLEIESKIIREECTEENKTFHFKAKGNEMKVGCSTIKESGSAEITGVAFVSFTRMELFLDESFFQDPQTLLAKPWRKLKMNSHVVQGIMTGERQGGFSDPVIYTLENIEPKQPFETPICISWDTDMEGGRWIHSGCLTHEASEMYTVCSCNRMMNLAIIMASGELTMEFSLYIISHVGLIISLVCLLLAIATFLLCRAIRNHNTYLHLHLCVCLFLAKALFLAGVDKTDSQTGCAIIAGFLHYLFLACFFWMLVEAVMLFLMVRNLKVMNYFSSRNIKMWYLCVFGYGLPGLVVAVSAGVRPKGYGMRDRCWLNPEMGFAWSFLGPVCVIIMINSILLTCTLCILRQKLSSVNAEVSTLKDTRLLTFKAFAQLFILGCTWVLGIFQIGPMARVMAYLFTIINSLQGTFIFTIHCLLNRQVREEYRRCITRKTKGSSESQTSGMLLSSVPSTSKTG